MNEEFLIVNTKILPDCYEKVLKTRRLLESGTYTDVSAAVKATGISRSTYYKYKDYIFSQNSGGNSRKAVLSLLLSHEIGILSRVLNQLSNMGASVLTISQTMPIHDIASVIITLDIASMKTTIATAVEQLNDLNGVESASLVQIE